MPSQRGEALEKAVAVGGLAVLALLYGYAARTLGWFPDSILDRAWRQGRAALETQAPDYLTARVYDRTGVRRPDSSAVAPGLTLVTTLWEENGRWLPGARLVDRDGSTVHQWRVDPGALFADSVSRRSLGLEHLDIQGSYLFPDGDLMVNIEYAGTVLMDACGDYRWKLPGGNHHSIERASDGTFWIPGVTGAPSSGSPNFPRGFPGIDRPVYQDQLVQVTADGRVLDAINVLDLIYENGLERYVVRARPLPRWEVTHLNDIQPLPDTLAEEYPLFEAGDLAVSVKLLNLVFVVDPDSRTIKWHASDPFIRQHDPDFIGDGWIGVFDNRQDGTRRGSVLGGSRIVAVQPHTDSVRVLFPTEESEPFYTGLRGKWQQLPGGSMLLTESEAGRVVEVGPDGGTVWDWVVEPYDESRVPYVSRGARVDVTREDVEGWECSSGPQ